MKARILVLAVNDGDEYVDLAAIADEDVLENNFGWLGEQVERARKEYGKALDGYGFIDVEIPDEAIKAVTRRFIDAGPITATPVAADGEN